MKKHHRKKRLPHLGIGVLFLFGSASVYAELSPQPRMSVSTDTFNQQQKLNLSLYNSILTLSPQGLFSTPMGLYIYANYPTKIKQYQLMVYRASDVENSRPLVRLLVDAVSPYEAVMWNGELDNGQTLSTHGEYKIILTALGYDGRQDSVSAAFFSTRGVASGDASPFLVYERAEDAGIAFKALSNNDTPYLSQGTVDGQPVQFVDLMKLSKMPDEEQAAFWSATVQQLRSHNRFRAGTASMVGATSAASITETEASTNDEPIVGQRLTLRGQLMESAEIPGFGLSNVDKQGMVASAQDRTVIVQMAGLAGKRDITLNGERLMVDNRGRAMRELVLSPGETTFDLSWTDEDGIRQSQTETLRVEQNNEFFYVGLVEATWAQNKVSGDGRSILEDADEHHYSGKGSWDGRVQFYLKGNMDEYRITAHLDTTETKLKNAFGRIGDKDPTRFTRELDPEAYYPIYGDDSTVENDVDTEGKFYVKLEKGKNYALWGNYNTQMTGTKFADFNRSLYGAKLYHENADVTQFGDIRSYATLFAATGDTRGSHNEFASTGGSLYFLKYQRVTTGSLKLSVELRDSNTGRVKGTTTLTEGVDFEIDNFQGRILLTKPLPITMSGGAGDSIISGGGLLNGDNVWLIADYEYYADGLNMEDQKVYGARAYGWLNDYLRVGASYIHEDQASGDSYQQKGADIILRATKGTQTHVEYALSDAGSNDIYVSTNGGLGFSQQSVSGDAKGAAWRIEQIADVGELFNNDIPLMFKGYYSMKQAGFSSFSTAQEHDLKEWGAELRYDFEADKNGVLVSYAREQERSLHEERIARAQYYQALTENLQAAIELQHRREDNYDATGLTKETLAAIKLSHRFFEGRDSGYVIQQVTVDKTGDVADNNKTTVGYESQIIDSLRLGAEVFGSNRGAGGGVFGNWDINERASVYTKVMNDIDSNAGRGITTTVGSNMKATSQMDLYSERQFKSQNIQRSTSDVYGVSYKPTTSHTIDASYSTGRVNYRNQGTTTLTGNNDTQRDVYLLGYGYKDVFFQIRNKVEYRWERGNNQTLKQWVTTNRAKTIISENFSWLGQLDLAKTTGSQDVVSNYTEAAIGFAYRPMAVNNLNLFGKVTFVKGYDPDDQLIATNSGSIHNDYEQKSWVYSLEGVYEWNQYIDTALKAAHRQGHLRYKGESEWFSSGASLYAARINVKYADWEYQLEGRSLRTSLADDHKDGIVTSVYRNVGDNLKMGVGYNFTDYNDNLTHLNYDARGWFINIVGSF